MTIILAHSRAHSARYGFSPFLRFSVSSTPRFSRFSRFSRSPLPKLPLLKNRLTSPALLVG